MSLFWPHRKQEGKTKNIGLMVHTDSNKYSYAKKHAQNKKQTKYEVEQQCGIAGAWGENRRFLLVPLLASSRELGKGRFPDLLTSQVLLVTLPVGQSLCIQTGTSNMKLPTLPGELIRMQNLTQSVGWGWRFYISNRQAGDASAARPSCAEQALECPW